MSIFVPDAFPLFPFPQSMLPNLSATPPFATLLRKDEDSKPSSLPPDNNLKTSLTMLDRKVCNTFPRKMHNRY